MLFRSIAASLSTVVQIRNVFPVAEISYLNGSLDNLVEGDTLNLTSDGTTDSDSDKINLLYRWKFEWRGEQDLGVFGPAVSLTDIPSGTWTINLTVTDDDNITSTKSITISVAEKPPEGFIEEFSESLGISPVMSIVIMCLVGLMSRLQ